MADTLTLAHVVGVAPLYQRTVTTSYAAYPRSDTSTLVPVGPDAGERRTRGTTVYDAEATLRLLPRPSTLWAPFTDAGTSNDAVAVPVGDAVTVATTVAVVPLYQRTETVSPGA
ncbi:MAG: hypothetical protein ACLGI3_16000 [Actinomycetes bacterium]